MSGCLRWAALLMGAVLAAAGAESEGTEGVPVPAEVPQDGGGMAPAVMLPTGPGVVPPPAAPQADFVLPSPDDFLAPPAVPVAEIRIERVMFEGNTVVSDRELAALCADFSRRSLIQEDLDELRFDIARLYISRGYLNSGAVIPDQDLADGVLKVAIIEGRLTETIIRQRRGEASGGALAPSYLRDRVAGRPTEPLHFPTLQRRLQLLQTNPNILRVNAELQPGALPGEALLVMDVTEPAGSRWRYGLDCHNQRPPSVGGEQAEIWLETANLTGHSDPLSLRLGLFTGDRGEPEFDPGQTASIRYARPLTAGDTMLELVASRQDYAVVDRVFVPLAIEGENWMAGAALRHPLVRSIRESREPAAGAADRFSWLRPWACCEGDGKSAGEMLARTVQDEVWLSLGLELSESATELLGRPFSISPGYVDGELDLAVLRFGQEWTRRTNDSVLALRSVVSAGLQGLGATRSPVEPDAEFFSWRLHGQYSARVSDSGDMLRIRAGAQWADDPLPPPEQWLLGGLHTVRGYRENMLVRDMGCFASIEYSLALPTGDSGWRLALVPFIDWGLGWDRERSDTTALCAPGLGLRAEYGDWFRGELFWGYALNHREWLAGDDAQDHGIHFLLTVAQF